ncbi:HEAT repeat domain-containing protein [Micromonospora sp. NPDC047740]|uniref:HEAT repeat domain-containing protein n=1 Tax=Micromonospora sp. NPDC047740 TaxID=3364254 RepID=UPI00371C3465
MGPHGRVASHLHRDPAPQTDQADHRVGRSSAARSPRPRPARPRAASDALGSAGGPAAVDALLALAADEDPQLRVQAADALPKVVDSDSRTTPLPATLARDDEAAVRRPPSADWPAPVAVHHTRNSSCSS